MMNMNNTVVSSDQYKRTKPTIVLIFTGAVEGELDLEEVATAALKFPAESRSYLVHWGGYLFWKRDKNFNVYNHISYYKPPKVQTDMDQVNVPLTYKDVDRIKSEIFQNPFVKKKSPWEILIVRNYISPKGEHGTCCIFRFHHSLGDGVSMIKQMLKLSDGRGSNATRIEPKLTFSKMGTNFFNTVYLLVWGPFVNIYDILLHALSNRNDWKKRPSKMQKAYSMSTNLQVSVQQVKDIKNFYGVSFASVTMCMIAGAVRKMMLVQEKKLPKKITCHTILPRPNHPDDKLTNHA